LEPWPSWLSPLGYKTSVDGFVVFTISLKKTRFSYLTDIIARMHLSGEKHQIRFISLLTELEVPSGAIS
jgi:hypothetical protein